MIDNFNDFIGKFQLRELLTSGPRYTWSNKQKDPLLVKLDRILATERWELQYPTCFSWAKARIGSDHFPILLNSGEKGDSRPIYFFFEDHWFQRTDFLEMIKKKWVEFSKNYKGDSYSMNRWHGCLQGLRQYLRGWSLRLIGQQREAKNKIAERIQTIDNSAEHRLLTMLEWEERIQLEKEWETILSTEDTYWRQRAGTKWVLQGDTNSHFYHQFANGRRRKNTISFLNSSEGEIRGQKEISDHIVQFYKQLFGHSSASLICLGDNFWPNKSKLSESQKSDLIKTFEKEEIHSVVKELKENSAPGPNGFSPGFFMKCWEII